jgi:hypothetical protein
MVVVTDQARCCVAAADPTGLRQGPSGLAFEIRLSLARKFCAAARRPVGTGAACSREHDGGPAALGGGGRKPQRHPVVDPAAVVGEGRSWVPSLEQYADGLGVWGHCGPLHNRTLILSLSSSAIRLTIWSCGMLTAFGSVTPAREPETRVSITAVPFSTRLTGSSYLRWGLDSPPPMSSMRRR